MTRLFDLEASIESVANETDYSGVVSVRRGKEALFERGWGFAHRGHLVKNSLDTRFGIASGAKGFTALGAMSLVVDGTIALDTSVRAVIGDELETIDPAVTVGHLLAHTSGIGDYFDEEAVGSIDEYVMPVPVHQLAAAPDYLAVLRGYPMRSKPGSRFAYNNGGYVVLALVIEAASGAAFHDLLDQRVFRPAGMSSTAFLRSDELPGSAALGYLATDRPRTNVFHLPVRGVGDGGAYSTTGDMAAFWHALFAGKILPLPVVAEMVREHNDVPSESSRYGLGFWLRRDSDTVMLTGSDAGVSFRSAYDPSTEFLYTVISNTSSGAWPLVKILDEALPELADA